MTERNISSTIHLDKCDISVRRDDGDWITNVSVIKIHEKEKNTGLVEVYKQLGEYLKATKLLEDPEHYYS